MDKAALVLAVIALGAVGYGMFGSGGDEGPAPATAASVTALEGTIASLQGEVEELQKALRVAQAAEVTARDAGKSATEELTAQITALAARLAKVEQVSKAPGGSIVAEELILKSKGGKTVLRLGARPSGGGEVQVFAKTGKTATRLFARSDNDGELVLNDHTGALRANIGGNDDGGYANFYGRTGTLAAYIGGDSAKDSGYLGLYGKDKKEIVGLYGNPKGGVISARNMANDKQVVMIGAAPNNGMGFIGLGTDTGKPAAAYFVTKNGGQAKMLNGEGKAVAFIGVSAKPAGNGLLYLCNDKADRVFESGAAETGGSYVSMHNGLKKRVLFMGTSSGAQPNDGVLEVAQRNGKLGVVLRGYSGANSVRVYDNNEKVIKQLR